MSNRVVVTGTGLVSPIGIGILPFWRSLMSGRSGIAKIASFEAGDFRVRFGCEVKDFTAEEDHFWGRSSQFAVAAARQALTDSGIDLDRFDPARAGVILGGSATDAPDEGCAQMAFDVARRFNLSGPVCSIWAACAAGNMALCQAFDVVREGRADWMLAGGVDSFSKRAFTGFSRLRLISPDLCRPFDLNRRGLILGEGSGMLVLESLTSARRRGARIRAEMRGYGLSCDGYQFVAPHPEGRGAAMAMNRALANAAISPDEIDYISAHGTGTPSNDKTETRAIKRVFGSRASQIPVSSIKALTGHCLGAAGALGAIACILGLESSAIPPTWNYQTPDPDCDLDCVPNEPREKRIRTALNNAYAFGGNNSCVVLSKFD